MRDSEALLLGATMLKPLRGCFITSDRTQGCAMGMIHVANTRETMIPGWMIKKTAALPCACKDLPSGERIMSGGGTMIPMSQFGGSVHAIIVHLFNQHVCDGDWTIEQLADWISKVEPVPAEESKPVAVVVEEPIYSAT